MSKSNVLGDSWAESLHIVPVRVTVCMCVVLGEMLVTGVSSQAPDPEMSLAWVADDGVGELSLSGRLGPFLPAHAEHPAIIRTRRRIDIVRPTRTPPPRAVRGIVRRWKLATE